MVKVGRRVFQHWVWIVKTGSPQRILVRSYIMYEGYQELIYPMLPLLGPDERYEYETKEITPKPVVEFESAHG